LSISGIERVVLTNLNNCFIKVYKTRHSFTCSTYSFLIFEAVPSTHIAITCTYTTTLSVSNLDRTSFTIETRTCFWSSLLLSPITNLPKPSITSIVAFNFPSSISTSANMRTSRFQSLSFSSLRTSLRRSSTSNGSIMSSNRDSYASNTSSPISTINAIMHRQPSMLDMEEERRSFGSGLEILEPRPLVYWGGLEERMGSL